MVKCNVLRGYNGDNIFDYHSRKLTLTAADLERTPQFCIGDGDEYDLNDNNCDTRVVERRVTRKCSATPNVSLARAGFDVGTMIIAAKE